MPFQPAAQSDSWVDELASAIAPELDATVTILTRGTTGVRNPETDEVTGGTEPTPIIVERGATSRNQSPGKETAAADQWRTVSIYRFTILRQVGDPLVKEGMLLDVVDGGYNPTITGTRMAVLESWATGPVLIVIAKVE